MALLQIKVNEYSSLLSGSNLEATNEVNLKIESRDYSAGTVQIEFTLSRPTKLVVWIG